MINLKNFLIFDLTKIGTAYLIINMFVDSDSIHVFEVSPLGSKAVLILSSSDLIALRFIEKECLSLFGSDILNLLFIEDIYDDVISCYLGQNVPNAKKHIAVIETASFAIALQTAQLIRSMNLMLLNFRVIRTDYPNLIITITDDHLNQLQHLEKNHLFTKITIIPSVQNSLKAYFEKN